MKRKPKQQQPAPTSAAQAKREVPQPVHNAGMVEQSMNGIVIGDGCYRTRVHRHY